MEQYIPKSALVAEIERIKEYQSICDDYWFPVIETLKSILSFLDTLEVKEVDLDKEVDDVMKRFLGNITCREEQLKFAKHFFELGIYSQLSWQDIRRFAEIGEEFMNSDESDNLNDEEYYTAILDKFKEKGRDYKTNRQEIRDLVQKGEEV